MFSFGQFNTITYPEQKDKKEHLHQSFSISTPQKVEEKKEVSTSKKAKRTTKSDLKKELDSLKTLIIDWNKKEQHKKIAHPGGQAYWRLNASRDSRMGV